MKKITTFIFAAFLANALFSQVKRDFSDYQLLKFPQNRQLVGTIKMGDTYTGPGVSEDLLVVSNSLEKYFGTDTLAFKGEILDVINSTFQMDKNKYQVVDLKELEITDCLDYGSLPLIKGNVVVVSTIRVKSIEIKAQKTFNEELKIDLGNFIKNQNLKFDPSITFNADKATVKVGKELVVAVKAIKITRNPRSYFFSSQRATKKGNNTFEFYEPDFNANSQIVFSSCDDLSTMVHDPSAYTEHQGCFKVSFVSPSITSGQNVMISRDVLLCPKRESIKGEIKLSENYRPGSKFTDGKAKDLISILTGNELVRYSFQIMEYKSTLYDSKPKPNVPSSNYLIGDIDVAWEVKKFKYKFEIAKK